MRFWKKQIMNSIDDTLNLDHQPVRTKTLNYEASWVRKTITIYRSIDQSKTSSDRDYTFIQ